MGGSARLQARHGPAAAGVICAELHRIGSTAPLLSAGLYAVGDHGIAVDTFQEALS